MRSSAALAVLLLLCNVNLVFSAQAVNGTFEAIRDCDALQSKEKGTNPGALSVQAGTIYQALEVNKLEQWTWVRVLIPDARVQESRRWVPKECGVVKLESMSPESGTGFCSTVDTFDSHVMILSWLPGFCEHHPNAPSKPECKALNNGQLVINHLTMHGLWPNKTGCGKGYGSCRNVPLDLTEDTISEISPYMPNFIYDEHFTLGRHQWHRYGTCRADDADMYFRLSLGILKIVDESFVGQFLKQNIGQDIVVGDYRQFIVRGDGEAVAKRISLQCIDGSKLQEIHINLPGDIDISGGIDLLVQNANPASQFQGNCDSRIHIEAPGL